MPGHHLSVRLDEETFERIEEQSRQSHQPRSQIVKTLLEEGLRMGAHPGVVFRAGPAGRRPGLAGGPDIWEIIRVLQEIPERGEEALRRTAELTGLVSEQVRVALGYYADFPAEIDEWIRRVDAEATKAEEAWQRSWEILKR
ncbi:MAG TPA: ribbon-helix-helix protein, CopG family [Chloroflexota bacterium]|nr:ribbon-helix-helix protein, CopG family [Chloroflexota bacterium]